MKKNTMVACLLSAALMVTATAPVFATSDVLLSPADLRRQTSVPVAVTEEEVTAEEALAELIAYLSAFSPEEVALHSPITMEWYGFSEENMIADNSEVGNAKMNRYTRLHSSINHAYFNNEVSGPTVAHNDLLDSVRRIDLESLVSDRNHI